MATDFGAERGRAARRGPARSAVCEEGMEAARLRREGRQAAAARRPRWLGQPRPHMARQDSWQESWTSRDAIPDGWWKAREARRGGPPGLVKLGGAACAGQVAANAAPSGRLGHQGWPTTPPR